MDFRLEMVDFMLTDADAVDARDGGEADGCLKTQAICQTCPRNQVVAGLLVNIPRNQQ